MSFPPRLQKYLPELPTLIVASMDFGSYLYGTNIEGSDTDYKGVFLPTADQLLMGESPKTASFKSNESNERNGPEDVDVEMFSLKRFLELLVEGQTVALDMLFAPMRFQHRTSEIWVRIVENREKLLTKNCGAAIGYARAQAHKYSLRGARMLALDHMLNRLSPANDSHPRQTVEEWLNGVDQPTLLSFFPESTHEFIKIVVQKDPVLGDSTFLEVCGKKVGFTASVQNAFNQFYRDFRGYGERAEKAMKQGADWKAMYHAVRIAAQTVELLNTGVVTFPRPEAPYLLQVRRGERSVEEVSERIEAGIAEIKDAQATSQLRDEPDRKLMRELVLSAHLAVVENR